MLILINLAVAKAFNEFSAQIRRKLLVLRKLIIEVATLTEGVGAIEETRKWG